MKTLENLDTYTAGFVCFLGIYFQLVEWLLEILFKKSLKWNETSFIPFQSPAFFCQKLGVTAWQRDSLSMCNFK